MLWCAALVLDTGGPYLFGAEGWKLVPGHFAERHGAIIIIALGESIVAIGAGAGTNVDAGVVAAAVLGSDRRVRAVVALLRRRRDRRRKAADQICAGARTKRDRARLLLLSAFPDGRRDRPVAVGMKQTLEHVGKPLGVVPAAAMLGGGALYLLAHVAFRWRNMHTLNRQRIVCAALLVAMLIIEISAAPPALLTLGLLALVLTALIIYEAMRFSEMRQRLRHQLAQEA